MGKRLKAQSAMEYLMTYGWAILIIAVVLGALFSLGVFSGSSLLAHIVHSKSRLPLPESCSFNKRHAYSTCWSEYRSNRL